MPDIDGIAERAEWFDASAYVGNYDLVGGAHSMTVAHDHGALWVRTADQSMRLWPAVDSPHRFRATQGWVTFLLQDGRAESVTYDVDGGSTMEAVRSR